MVKPRRLLSKKEVLRLVPRSYPWIWRAMRRNEFPRGVVLAGSGGEIAWFEDEIDAWLSNLPRQRLKGDPGLEHGDPKILKIAALSAAPEVRKRAVAKRKLSSASRVRPRPLTGAPRRMP